MATFAQLKGRVGDLTHRPKNQDDAELGALVNDAYAHVVAELGIIEKTVTATLTANVGDYTMSAAPFNLTDFAAFRSIVYSPANGFAAGDTLSPTTVDEVLGLRSANPSSSSPAAVYAVRGWQELLFQPLPGAGDTASVTYVAFPTDMSNPTDVPSALPRNWQHLIVSYAGAVAMEVVSVARAQQLMEAFEQGELKRARRWFNDQYGSRPLAPGTTTGRVSWPSDRGAW